MANKRMMKTTRTNPVDSVEEIVEETTEEIVENNTIEKKVVEKRVFDPEEYIDCKAVNMGKTFIEGKKSKDTFSFEGEGDIVGIPYKDLEDMVRTKSPYMFNPWIIVVDEDFVEAFPRLKEFYESMYSEGDIREILNLSATRLAEELPKLPHGVQEAVKNTAMSMVANGSMDSISKLKVLDDFFGTIMMETTGLYGD